MAHNYPGATPAEWDHWSLVLGLGQDLLPVVSRIGAKISPLSTLKATGKVPSRYNAAGDVVGIPHWTAVHATEAQLEQWRKNHDYGICLQTRHVVAIDVDLSVVGLVARVRILASQMLGVQPAVRCRPGAARIALAVCCDSVVAKRIVRCGSDGAIELLGTGQQFVVAGTHPSGGRYFWEGGLPGDIPEVPGEALGQLFDALEREFGTGAPEARRPDRAAAGAGERGRGSSDEELSPSAQLDRGAGEAAAGSVVDGGEAVRRPRRPVEHDAVSAWLTERGWARTGHSALHGLTGRHGELRVWCPWLEEHTGDSGATEAVWYPAGTRGYESGHFHCLHAHCAGRTDEEFLNAVGWRLSMLPEIEEIDDDVFFNSGRRTGAADRVGDPVYGGDDRDDREQRRLGDHRALAGGAPAAPDHEGGHAVGQALEVVPSHEDAVGSWSSSVPGQGLTRTRAGILATVRNVRRALSTPGYWRRIGLDDFGAVIKWCEWRGPNAGQWLTWTDEDNTSAREQLELDGFAPVGRELIRDVVARVALGNRFDSAILWLTRLEPAWDGVPRVAGFFEQYMSARAEDHAGGSEYLRAVGEFLWTALAGRVLSPGCKVDMSPVLVGAGGGQGKTEGVAALAPSAEMACRVNLKHADAEIARLLRGVLAAEFAELRGLRGRDSEDIKDFLSARSDKWTQKYKEFAHTVMRRCVFIGTTDNEAFLSDPVGNFRRWLPVRVGAVDVTAIESDRLQLWAEAAVLWRSGGVAWQAAEALARAEHHGFVIDDSWAEVVEKWLEEAVPDDLADGAGGGTNLASWGARGFTAREALVLAIGINTSNISRGHEMRMAEVLKTMRLVQKRGSRTDGRKSLRVWRQPGR